MVLVVTGCNESGLPGFTETLSSSWIKEISPVENAENIVTNTAISATFYKSLDPASVNEESFIVLDDTTSIAGSLFYDNSTITFSPSQNLPVNSVINVTITGEIMDIDGNSMNQDYNWSFTTIGQSNAVFPLVTRTDPAHKAVDIPIYSTVMVIFNKEMDPSTLNLSTFFVEQNGTNLSGSIETSDTTAVFSPSKELKSEQTYTATITEGVQDLAGNSLANNYSWNFTTEKETDRTPPEIMETHPGDGEDDIDMNTSIAATFNESMDPATISSSTFLLSDNNTSINGSVTYANNTATFKPSDELKGKTTYTAVIADEVADLAGNELSTPYKWSFETEIDYTVIPPEIIETVPVRNARDVSRDITITITFSEPLNPTSVTEETVFIHRKIRGHEIRIPSTVSYSENIVSLNPDRNLKEETFYTVTITRGISDRFGNLLADEYQWRFETEDDDDDDDDD